MNGDDAPAGGESNGDAARSRGNGRSRSPQRSAQRPAQQIEDLLKAGQEILVQVVKEPLGTKGARGHVPTPASPGASSSSCPPPTTSACRARIDSREERSRLRGIVRQFRDEHGFTGGIIIRTAAARRPKGDIEGDLRYFHELWSEMRGNMESLRAPAVIHYEESLVAKLIRDFLNDDFSAIRIDDREEHARVVRLVERIMPGMVERVRHYAKEFSDLRGIRRAGRDRQGDPEQGVAQVGRLHRDQPDGGPSSRST